MNRIKQVMRAFYLGSVVALLCTSVAASAAKGDDAQTSGNHDTVVWISMDGMRADYLDRAPLPFLHRMMSEGLFTRRSRPTFPSITFPSHCSQATGTGVNAHGISGNSFYDSATHQRYNYPADNSLLGAEPIWLTASRQGVRTLVFDWPLSQKETGENHAAYFNQEFGLASDEQRLTALLDTWRKDAATHTEQPLRLLMGYVEGTDPAGHKFGPDSQEVTEEMVRLDKELAVFQEAALSQWKSSGADGHIYFLFTTDHGMSKVEKVVDLDKLVGVMPKSTEINLAFTGNTGSVFFDGIADTKARQAREEEIYAKLKAVPYAQTYKREELPPEWHYAHPTRVGDIVVVLAKGYSFNRFQPETVMDAAAVAKAPKGMHGYAINEDPEMYGPLILWRYPEGFAGKELEQVTWDQLHPTIAKILGISPSEKAVGQVIPLP